MSVIKRVFEDAVVIGRFRPFHRGHKRLVDYALKRANKVTVVIGSKSLERTARNIFLVPEVRKMIRLVYPDANKVCITSVEDMPGDDGRWANSVVRRLHDVSSNALLVGCDKDSSSFYLSLFSTWRLETLECSDNISATEIRRRFFSWQRIPRIFLPLEVHNYLEQFKATDAYRECLDVLTHANLLGKERGSA